MNAGPRRIRIAAVAAGVLVMSVGAWLGPDRAHAAVVPVRPVPLTVVVSGPQTVISMDAVSTAGMASGQHGVVLRSGQVVIYSTGSGDNSSGLALVHVSGQVPSRVLGPGTSPATLTDVGDGRTIGIPLTVLRRSRVTLTGVTPAGAGRAWVTGQARHYDLISDAYRGDMDSPVLVQVLCGRSWSTSATATTAPDGFVVAVIPLPACSRAVRLVRPAGATVTGAASSSIPAPSPV